MVSGGRPSIAAAVTWGVETAAVDKAGADEVRVSAGDPDANSRRCRLAAIEAAVERDDGAMDFGVPLQGEHEGVAIDDAGRR